MPSWPHEALVLLFRNRPSLAPELLREALGVELPEYADVRLAPADLTEVAPAQYLADLVVLLRARPPSPSPAAEAPPVLAVVVEAQLGRDEQKRLSWPAYLATARARHRCEALVMVVAPEPAVARWAARPSALGPGSVVRPWVLGPDRVPVLTDEAGARAAPELAVLSVMAHGKGDPVRAAAIAAAAAASVEAVEDRELFLLYSDLIGARRGREHQPTRHRADADRRLERRRTLPRRLRRTARESQGRGVVLPDRAFRRARRLPRRAARAARDRFLGSRTTGRARSAIQRRRVLDLRDHGRRVPRHAAQRGPREGRPPIRPTAEAVPCSRTTRR